MYYSTYDGNEFQLKNESPEMKDSVLNYLARVDKKFFHSWYQKHSFTKLDAISWGNDINNYFQSLFVPFSYDSLNEEHYGVYIDNLEKDFLGLFSPFVLFFVTIDQFGYFFGFIVSLLAQILAPFLIAIALIDIALQATTLALSLLTRSIATLGYMINYWINGDELFSTKTISSEELEQNAKSQNIMSID